MIGDDDIDPAGVQVLLLCSGRITWDLFVERKKRAAEGRTAIARLEQLYPRPVSEVKAELAKYPNLREIRWVQDEPSNMGPWPHMALNLAPELETDIPFRVVSRLASAAPSAGHKAQHLEELASIFERAFA